MPELFHRADGNEKVQALWWGQELVPVHGKIGNWARDSEVLCAVGARKSGGFGQDYLQGHS